MLTIRWRRRDERGAIAVMVGLLSVLLLTMAALGTDLGQAWAQKRQIQGGSDLATLAGAGISGNDLPAPTVGKTCSYGHGALATDPASVDVARYLASKAYSPTLAPAAVPAATVTAMATQLTDCNVQNGEVFYGQPTYNKATNSWTSTFNKNQLSLVSPPSQVDFGFARILGFNNVNVTGQSTVEIQSPKFSALPFYAFNGCDYGPQTLQQPNNGHSAAAVMLYLPGDNANVTLNSISPTTYPVDTTGTVTEPLVINGSGWTTSNVQKIGFFESGNGVDGPPPVTILPAAFTVNSTTKITIPDLPDQTRGVSGVQEFWYIRVMIGGVWSKYSIDNSGNVVNAPMLTIGDPPLLCGQGSSSGNFGTLLLSHPPYNGADNVGAANVALGLTNSLAIYPSGGPADGTCSSSQTTTVLWNTDGTNCVDTDTGMSAKVAGGGFLGISSAAVGGNQYLMYPTHKTKCANGGTSEATTTISGQLVNNDTLTCFFLSPTTHVSDVDADPTAGGYTGTTPLISPDIYNSPRFAYVPVLNVQPANGGSNKYQIVDFRACFITDQPGSAIKGDGPATANNGFIMDSNGVNSVQVIFLNPNALPVPPVANGTINYVGSGPKVPILVN
jgi:Flp pilus assembly protein TadG